ncbi:hypothetical protein B0J13DRAFT_143201 [Dactylonectria estremocensis]|uniref:Secreted protein n=1 Tax=Dactylonectria estremocensis TaxID=1079267 RepID=A0A9P9DX10_9HYPO|nr:hypothetical protein B0J13DRAFT_143201 [Dactylonectria estremocensis]
MYLFKVVNILILAPFFQSFQTSTTDLTIDFAIAFPSYPSSACHLSPGTKTQQRHTLGPCPRRTMPAEYLCTVDHLPKHR